MRRPFKRGWRTVAWWGLLLEAALYLLLARLALRLVPFQFLTRFFARPARQPELAGNQRSETRSAVQRAIWLVAPRLPGKIVCFPKAIAAQALLRRRRIGTVLYYGAKTVGGTRLQSHVWVQDGEHPVVGKLASQDFAVISRYPAASPPNPASNAG